MDEVSDRLGKSQLEKKCEIKPPLGTCETYWNEVGYGTVIKKCQNMIKMISQFASMGTVPFWFQRYVHGKPISAHSGPGGGV